ncbi:MAG: hypothetical protein L3J24_00520 [Xanthomonadales bacterium]|nr:hypothetical protein [Xanthomonadales bacterium]
MPLLSAILIGFFLLSPQLLTAADALPETEIFLLDLSTDYAEPVNISTHEGYDNQPAFSTDGKRIYYSRADDGQTDIWYYDIEGSLNIRISRTPESEYSPRPAPHENKLSVVRVEMGGAQRLSLLDLETNEFNNLAEELSTVGYYSWFSPGSVALFLLPEPFSLILYASKDEQVAIAESIGRAITKNPLTGDLLFVDKSASPWKITAFNLATREKTVIAKLFPQHEDFAITAEGTLWTALGGKLYNREIGDNNWKLVMDLRAYELNNITRLVISPDGTKMALVNSAALKKQRTP